MIEQDSIGQIEIPDNVYYGAYSKRSAEMEASPYKFIDVMPDYVQSIFLIKQCAAKANMERSIRFTMAFCIVSIALLVSIQVLLRYAFELSVIIIEEILDPPY